MGYGFGGDPLLPSAPSPITHHPSPVNLLSQLPPLGILLRERGCSIKGRAVDSGREPKGGKDDALVEALCGIPLALAISRAYLEETKTPLDAYLARFVALEGEILGRGTLSAEYPIGISAAL